jgi:hypothetical protein
LDFRIGATLVPIQKAPPPRRERTAPIQGTWPQSDFMRQPTGPGWVYGCDAWTVPLPKYASKRPIRLGNQSAGWRVIAA